MPVCRVKKSAGISEDALVLVESVADAAHYTVRAIARLSFVMRPFTWFCNLKPFACKLSLECESLCTYASGPSSLSGCRRVRLANQQALLSRLRGPRMGRWPCVPNASSQATSNFTDLRHLADGIAHWFRDCNVFLSQSPNSSEGVVVLCLSSTGMWYRFRNCAVQSSIS